MVLVTVLQNLTWVVSLIYMGHLGELELAAAAVATSMCSVTGNCVQVPLLLSFDLFSQKNVFPISRPKKKMYTFFFSVSSFGVFFFPIAPAQILVSP